MPHQAYAEKFGFPSTSDPTKTVGKGKSKVCAPNATLAILKASCKQRTMIPYLKSVTSSTVKSKGRIKKDNL
jgi:hypothetical protein